MSIKIDYNKCCWKNGQCASCGCGGGACRGCAEACPVSAIARNIKLEIDKTKCIECGICVGACKYQALSLI